MIEYVAGFMFNESLKKVLLIKKNRPEWQAGRLNGIGGKVETGESPEQALAREFKEETGISTQPNDWSVFCSLTNNENYIVHFGRTVGPIHLAKSITDEEVLQVDINHLPNICIYNLNWLIPLALDSDIENSTVIDAGEN